MHDGGPDAMRIEVFASFVEQRLRGRGFEPRNKAIAQQPAGGIGDKRQDTHRHLAKVDVALRISDLMGTTVSRISTMRTVVTSLQQSTTKKAS
jgi:hypothetical protein